MNIIDVTIELNVSSNSLDKFIAVDKHPYLYPKKPIITDFKMKGADKDKFDTDKFNEALNKYKEECVAWSDIYVNLKRYKITELECMSGVRLNANIIEFYCNDHSKNNELRKAILNEDGTVIITAKKY